MHNVGTTLRLAYHGCENLTHTSKTRFVKRTQLVEMLGSRFACLLLFQTAKNWTQRNRRAKWREVQIRTVARKYSTGRYYICAGRLDILKIWQNVHRSVVFYISIWEAENRALIWGIRPNRAFVIFFLFPYFLSLWGRVQWLPTGKVTFACYSRSPISLRFLAWEQYKLAQVLNSNLISEWLSERKLKWKESHLKTPRELYLIETLTRLRYLFTRSNYV